MFDIRVNNLSLKPILSGPPKISDQLNAVCRTLEIPIQNADGLEAYIGQSVNLWYDNARWFFGFLKGKNVKSNGSITYTVVDPLYFMNRSPDDWHFQNMTATQAFKILAQRCGIRYRDSDLANTGTVLPTLFYKGAEADKVGIDLLARTYNLSKNKFWYRYKPDYPADGLYLFKREIPSEIWAFQTGINLIETEKSESITDDTCTVVKLVDRDSGKVVTKTDPAFMNQYGHMVHFEEVEKEQVNSMEKIALEKLEDLKKIEVTVRVTGVNIDRIMPQLFSGDAIYVEEKTTRLMGGFYIRNITHTFESDNLVTLELDVQATPDIPTIQYTDVDKASTVAPRPTDVIETPNPAKTGGVGTEFYAEYQQLNKNYGVSYMEGLK